MQRFLPQLSEKIVQGEVDPNFVISHRVTLEDVPKMYELWNKKEDGVVKVAWIPYHRHLVLGAAGAGSR